jgi:Ubiquitin carboxyl-terminal hydrolase
MGASCYLNTLLQMLFNDQEFRNLIFSVDNSGAGSSPILREMQRFFTFLLHSQALAVSAADLADSFGWSRSQVFEQHDIHELFSVLLDALSRTAPPLQLGIAKLFQGQSVGECDSDYLPHLHALMTDRRSTNMS